MVKPFISPGQTNPDSSFSSVPSESTTLDFNTPLPPSPENSRNKWKFTKARNLYPALYQTQLMEELSSIKRLITRKLNACCPVIENAVTQIDNFRSDKSLDSSSQEYESLHNFLDDLKVIHKLVEEKFNAGNSLCEQIDPSEECISKWKEYLEEKEETLEKLKDTVLLLGNTLDRAESRSVLKSKINHEQSNSALGSGNSRPFGDQFPVQPSIPLDRDQIIDSESSPHLASSSRPLSRTVNSDLWGNRLSRRTRALNDGNSLSAAPQLHLPRHFFEVEIPNFDGTHETWDNFWSMFNRFVHSQNFENSIKLSILSKHCVGSARKYVDLARQNGDFYERTIQKMINAFDNAYKKRNSLLKTLEQIKKAGNSAQSQDATLARIRTILQGLETCDHINSANLQRDVKSKFPIDLVMQMEKMERSHVGDWTTEHLMDALENEIELRQIEEDVRKNLRGEVFGSTKLVSNTVARNLPISQNSADKFCYFHDRAGHSSGECKKFVSPPEIRKIAREHNLCLNCLDIGHRATDCTVAPCRKCPNSRHHEKLCEKSGRTPPGNATRPNYINNSRSFGNFNGPRNNFRGQSNFVSNSAPNLRPSPNATNPANIVQSTAQPNPAGNYGQHNFRAEN